MLAGHFESEKMRAMESCLRCGLCVQVCPVVGRTDLADLVPEDIQSEVIDFLETGLPNDTVFTRAFACLQCWKCVDDICPVGLDPLLINEIVKWEYRKKQIVISEYTDPKDEHSSNRVLAGIQVSRVELEKILTPTKNDAAGLLFFPGCNVYRQPEKILYALDILDLLKIAYSFLPGLDSCCGNIHLCYGEVEKADEGAVDLLEKLASYQADTVICWCANCAVRLEKTFSQLEKLPFQVKTFPQVLAEKTADLPFKKEIDKNLTLHEICTMGYTGLDPSGPADVLRALPGATLTEMPRRGRDTVCCGIMAMDFFPKCYETMRDSRLEEAAQTNADIMVNVCHACHEVFMTKETEHNFAVVNYITLVAQALGIDREDKFKKYMQWGDVDRILEDAGDLIESSPYPLETIIAVLKETFSAEN